MVFLSEAALYQWRLAAFGLAEATTSTSPLRLHLSLLMTASHSLSGPDDTPT